MRTRIAIVFTPILLLACLWGVVGYWTLTERATILAEEEKDLTRLDSAVAENVNGLFKLVELSLMSVNYWMAQHPQTDPVTSPDFIDLTRSIRRTSNGIVDIRLVTRQGKLRYITHSPVAADIDVSDREYYTAQLSGETRGLFIASPVQSRVTGKWSIPIAVPVDKAGGDIAVAYGVIEADHFLALHETQRTKPNGSILLMRTDGMVLSRTPYDEALLGRSLAGTPGYSQHMGRLERGMFVSHGVQTDGVDRLVSFQRLAEYPVVVAVTSGIEDTLAPWGESVAYRFVILAVVTLGVCAISWKLNRAMGLYDTTRRELERLATTDYLTGIGNRRVFFAQADQEVERARRFSHSLSLLVVDIDHFKTVNDRFGHTAGDLVLKHVAQVLCASCRKSDICARLGGEEFGVLLVETQPGQALGAARRLCAMIQNEEFGIPGGELRLSVSIGIASLGERTPDFDKMYQAADEALYRAKNSGRNQVVTDG